jgi:hypothetical protein
VRQRYRRPLLPQSAAALSWSVRWSGRTFLGSAVRIRPVSTFPQRRASPHGAQRCSAHGRGRLRGWGDSKGPRLRVRSLSAVHAHWRPQRALKDASLRSHTRACRILAPCTARVCVCCRRWACTAGAWCASFTEAGLPAGGWRADGAGTVSGGHQVRLTQWSFGTNLEGHCAECSCGWSGMLRFTIGSAMTEGNEHVREHQPWLSRLLHRHSAEAVVD